MKILIKHRGEAQATKILEQERAEEDLAIQMEFGDPEPEPEQEEVVVPSIHFDEADEYFDWISGQYSSAEEQ